MISKLSFSRVLYTLFAILLAQTCKVLKKTNKGIAICLILLCTFIGLFYKAILLEEIMHEPKTWCETLECFGESGKDFLLPTDSIAFEALMHKKDKFIKKSWMTARSKKFQWMNVDIKYVFDCMSEKQILLWTVRQERSFMAIRNMVHKMMIGS